MSPAACFLAGALALAPFLQEELPPLQWTCPMHREVSETDRGACAQCNMALVPTRIREAWTCPLHSLVVERAPGECPLCRRGLVPTSLELRWTCSRHPAVSEPSPGTCPVCEISLDLKESVRPHQDHNPKHGGIFFMSPDNWHHLEGTYPEPGVFRVHFYDNYSRPLDAKAFKARSVTREVWDAERRSYRELMAYPMLPAGGGAYLEARVGTQSLPAAITAKIRFEGGGPEERFDFVFSAYSEEPEEGPSTMEPAIRSDPPIPDAAEDIVSALGGLEREIAALIQRGAFTEIWAPALRAKDLALALEGRLAAMTDEKQVQARRATRHLVRSAWMLDAYGDLGNRERVRTVYQVFHSSVRDIEAVFVGR